MFLDRVFVVCLGSVSSKHTDRHSIDCPAVDERYCIVGQESKKEMEDSPRSTGQSLFSGARWTRTQTHTHSRHTHTHTRTTPARTHVHTRDWRGERAMLVVVNESGKIKRRPAEPGTTEGNTKIRPRRFFFFFLVFFFFFFLILFFFFFLIFFYFFFRKTANQFGKEREKEKG